MALNLGLYQLCISHWTVHTLWVSLPDLVFFFSFDGKIYWMNELDTYIPPNIRLINPISKRFTPNLRFTSHELPTWVEQSQDLMLRSTVYFSSSLIRTLSCLSIIFQIAYFLAHFLLLAIYALHDGYLFATDTLSTPTITEPPSVECQDLLIPTRSNACVLRKY